MIVCINEKRFKLQYCYENEDKNIRFNIGFSVDGIRYYVSGIYFVEAKTFVFDEDKRDKMSKKVQSLIMKYNRELFAYADKITK